MPSFSQTFSSSGSWTCPPDYLPGSIIVMCWGEGGSGGTSVHGARGGGGGGGGEFAQDSPSVTAGNSYPVTIGAGSTGTNTTFVGDVLTVRANAGASTGGQTGGAGGTGSTNATHFDGGTGGAAGAGSSASGAGGGGSAGSGSSGGTGASVVTGGTAGTGTNPGAVGGAGGASLAPGSNGIAPGSGAGGGGGGGTINHGGGTGAAGQVIVFWQTFVPAPPPMQRHSGSIVPIRFVTRSHQSADVVIKQQSLPWDPPRYPQRVPAPVARIRTQKQEPTGWPVPVQPPFPPGNAERRWTKPPYPRRGVTITPWPSRNIPTSEWFRRDYPPPWPRRGKIPPSGLPVAVQPPFFSGTGRRAKLYRHLKPHRGSAPWPGTAAPLIQPPFSTWVYKRRWTKPLFPRKGVTPPTALPFVAPATAYNPSYELRPQKYHWFRRGNVAPTGWPIPVQPAMTSQSLRRPYKPPWPRRGVEPPTNLPEPVPTSTRMRRSQKYQWFRKGTAVPNTGLPVPVQPTELPHSVRRYSRPLIPRKQSTKFSAFFIPVQPPERMQSVHRWTKPLFPRRGRTNIATFPGAQAIVGYQELPLQQFGYTPGQPGVDFTQTGLTLFPLNTFGYTFFNRYGNVLLVVLNKTTLPVTIQPNVIRRVENQIVQIPASVISPGQMQAFGPFPCDDFANPDLIHPSTSYYMTVNVSANDSGVFAGAFLLVPAPLIGHVGPFDRFFAMLRRLITGHHTNTSSTPGEILPGDSTPGA